MPRQPRIVAPGYPHHVVQRGARRLPVFFHEADYRTYIDLVAEEAMENRVAIWAYCLMPNHVHFIAVPEEADGLARTFREAHRRYSRLVNRREDWTGNLWQGRFFSSVMDEAHTIMAARYIELNPVAARIVRKPWLYQWSSADAHRLGRDDGLVQTQPLLDLIPEWECYLTGAGKSVRFDEEQESWFEGERKPPLVLGARSFAKRLEKRLGLSLEPSRRGRPKKIE